MFRTCSDVSYETARADDVGYVTLLGILEYKCKVLRKATGRKQNSLGWNYVEDILVNGLREKSYEILYNKLD